MSGSADPSTGHTGAPDHANAEDAFTGSRALQRGVYALAVLTLAFLVLAVALNWLAVRDRATYATGEAGEAIPGVVGTGTVIFQPELAAADRLPLDIISYETIVRHEVPGRGNQAGEAIYATLNMNIEIQRPISVYALVEEFSSSDEAERALAERMTEYATRAETIQVGGRIADSGYRADEGAWAVGWVDGSSYTFVKTAFKDLVPVQKKDFLRSIGRPAVEAIEVYQRTGKQGIQQ